MPSCPRCGTDVPSKPGGATCPKCGEFVPEKETTYPEGKDEGNMILKRNITQGTPIDCMRVMLQKTRACPHVKINGPGDSVKLMKEMGDYERERGMILHLNTKNEVIGIENISTGSINQSIIHPRESIKGAVLNSAAHVLFIHNHPSGNPEPSAEDINITARLRAAFDCVGIDLLDSIIMGGRNIL